MQRLQLIRLERERLCSSGVQLPAEASSCNPLCEAPVSVAPPCLPPSQPSTVTMSSIVERSVSWVAELYTTSAPSAPILNLPFELLSEIASHVIERHPSTGCAVSLSSLAALCRASRTWHAITIPLLYRDILITSDARFRALLYAPEDFLRLSRELNIFMDVQFLDAWKAWAFVDTTGGSRDGSLYRTLASVLFRTSSLQTLRIRVAEITGPRSGWGKFALSNAHGVPIGRAIQESLGNMPTPSLPSIKKLELDAFQDIAPLLRLMPNLESLSMNLSGGYPQYVNHEIIQALKSVPRLRHLAYTPESLRFNFLFSQEGGPWGNETGMTLDEELSVEFLKVLGKTLPKLETLDLQSRLYGDNIYFCSGVEPLSPSSLRNTLQLFPKLRHLALPSSVLPLPDHSILRSLTSPLLLRRVTLERIEPLESTWVKEFAQMSPNLRSISFVRAAVAHQRKEYAISYKLAPASPGPHVPDNSTPRNSSSEVPTGVVSDPSDSQVAQWPFTSSMSFGYSVSKLWLAPPNSRPGLILSYIQDHDAVLKTLKIVKESELGRIGRDWYNGSDAAQLVVSIATCSASLFWTRLFGAP